MYTDTSKILKDVTVRGSQRPVGGNLTVWGRSAIEIDEPAVRSIVEGTEVTRKRRIERFGHETALGLARRPFVQLLLAGTALAQVMAIQAGLQPRADINDRVAEVIQLEPVAVTDPSVRDAWLERAVSRESARLGAEYRTKGYAITPRLAEQIGKAAAEFEIEPEVAFGLVKAESSFRNQATSRVGAVGLTQLMPRTAAWMEPGVTRSQLRDPETNLRIGFKYLRYLLDKYEGDERLALLAYNRGPGTVDNALRRGRNPDNGYADFVFGNPDHGHRLFTRR